MALYTIERSVSARLVCKDWKAVYSPYPDTCPHCGTPQSSYVPHTDSDFEIDVKYKTQLWSVHWYVGCGKGKREVTRFTTLTARQRGKQLALWIWKLWQCQYWFQLPPQITSNSVIAAKSIRTINDFLMVPSMSCSFSVHHWMYFCHCVWEESAL